MTENLHTALLIGIMSLVTLALRALPFWIFTGKRQVPQVILYLGQVLPSAALGMLVVYCMRDLNFTAASSGIYQLLACAAVVLAQCLKRNTIVSILAGTAVYMLLS